MNKEIIFLFFTILVSEGTSSAQIIPYNSELVETDYEKKIEIRRMNEEKSFRNKETTLLSDEYFSHFTGLNYFAVDASFRVIGKLTKMSESERINLDLTDGSAYRFMRYGTVNFSIEGVSP